MTVKETEADREHIKTKRRVRAALLLDRMVAAHNGAIEAFACARLADFFELHGEFEFTAREFEGLLNVTLG